MSGAQRANGRLSAPVARPCQPPAVETLPITLTAEGPCKDVSVEDSSAPTVLKFRSDDEWTTSWCEFDGVKDPEPPHWGLATWVRVPAGETLAFHLTQGVIPKAMTHRIHSTTLLMSENPERYMSIGGGPLVEFGLPDGAYPVDVWVDAPVREDVRQVAYVLGTSDEVRR